MCSSSHLRSPKIWGIPHADSSHFMTDLSSGERPRGWSCAKVHDVTLCFCLARKKVVERTRLLLVLQMYASMYFQIHVLNVPMTRYVQVDPCFHHPNDRNSVPADRAVSGGSLPPLAERGASVFCHAWFHRSDWQSPVPISIARRVNHASRPLAAC